MNKPLNNHGGTRFANSSLSDAAHSSGYSNTELTKKLGYNTSETSYFVNPPKEYLRMIGVDSKPLGTQTHYDFIHAFYSSKNDLASAASDHVQKLDQKGMLWISWPKKSQKVIQSDITEQDLRDIFLPLGVVDVKVCAVTDVWSGLKFVWRKK